MNFFFYPRVHDRSDRVGVELSNWVCCTAALLVKQVGLDNLRTIETEVEKHVDELLDLFSAEQHGKAGRFSVQQPL